MSGEEILELVRAGYTKAEIEGMNAGAALAAEQEPEQEPETAPEENPAPAPEPEKPAAPERAAPDDTGDRLTKLENSIATLVAAIQSSNIINTGKPSAPTLTAEEALASLITDKRGGK